MGEKNDDDAVRDSAKNSIAGLSDQPCLPQ
jgi:hypothetical protein